MPVSSPMTIIALYYALFVNNYNMHLNRFEAAQNKLLKQTVFVMKESLSLKLYLSVKKKNFKYVYNF